MEQSTIDPAAAGAAQHLAARASATPVFDALADWHLDEYLWSGAEGEVRDTLANAHATAAGGASSSAEVIASDQ